VKQLFRHLRESCLELLFPSRCLACRQPVAPGTLPMFCPSCLSQVELLQGPLCPGCGRRFPKAAGGPHFCGLCLSGHYHFNRARAVAIYAEPFSTVLHRFKYQGESCGLKSFKALLELLPEPPCPVMPELILPVPLHPGRLRQRGYNQAAVLARAFFPHQRKILRNDILLRVRPTEPQTGLSGRARRRNLRRAFGVKDPARVEGRRILLVDDVFTTGTTVNECARILKKAGADEVCVLTLARVRE
jgi:ComF family protein